MSSLKFILFLILMPLTVAACSEQSDTAEDTKEAEDTLPVIDQEKIKAHMQFLADDKLKGRASGTPEYRIAADYVADHFKSLGLKPAGDKDSYFQTVNFTNYAFDAEKTTFSVGEQDFTFKDDFFILANVARPDVTVAGKEILFVGYGDPASLEGVDISGKTIAYLPGKQNNFTGTKASIALRTAASDKRRPYTRIVDYFTKPGVTMLDPDGVPLSQGPQGQTTLVVLSTKTSDALASAADTTLEALEEMAQAEDFKPVTLTMDFKINNKINTSGTIDSPNVIGVLEGSDPVLKDEYVIISAHLDHVGQNCRLGKAKDKADAICNGAMDNASGTATMLEAARAFTQKKAPKRSVIFIALTAEEMGLLGAQYFTNYPTLPIEKIVANVNLDMPILTYDFADVVAFGGEHSTMGAIAEQALAKIGVALAVDPMPEQNLFRRSDHYRFVLKGIPSVFLMSGPTEVGQPAGSGLKKFEEFLATNYHSKADDMDQPLMFDVAAKFALSNYLIINEVANSAERPLWYEGNEYGEKYAPGQDRAQPSPRALERRKEAEQVKQARAEELKKRRQQ